MVAVRDGSRFIGKSFMYKTFDINPDVEYLQ